MGKGRTRTTEISLQAFVLGLLSCQVHIEESFKGFSLPFSPVIHTTAYSDFTCSIQQREPAQEPSIPSVPRYQQAWSSTGKARTEFF